MVISLLLPVLSTLLIGGIAVGILAGWYGHEGRANTVATGQGSPISNSDGTTARMDVWWTDAGGSGHEARFRVPEGSTLGRGPFEIRYDPADPEGPAFPAGADAGTVIPPSPPWWVLLFAAPFVLLTVGIGGGWQRRVAAARTAAAQPGVPYRVVPFVLEGVAAGLGQTRTIDVGLGVLLVPRDAPFDQAVHDVGRPVTPPPEARWQRTMWTPGFGCLRPGREVIAHISDGDGGRAVLVTEDGTIWPATRLHDTGLPRRLLTRVAGLSAINSRISPGKTYLLAPLAGFFVAPVAFQTPVALLFLPLVLLFGYSVTIMTWAWRGGIPADH